ncbi:MAG: 3-dehydroquinate synthase [Thermodesulfobacteriota bacterium]|nr:3-dehydroquinate synthase [Thermodesulfobacteriota bacterium]
MNKIKVNLDKKISASYEICIGQDIFDRIEMIIARNNCASRYVIITDSNVSTLHGERFLTTLKETGLKVDMIEFPAGEVSKNIDTVLDIAKKLIEMGVDRKSALIALGGGVVGDIVGYAASIYMRGIPYYQIPTTLLAQVDSSIGGKTAIDLPEGKNLLGTFHQPKGVFIDLSFLNTLPSREFKNGMAEIIKYGIIEDTELFSLLESEMKAIMDRDMAILSLIIGKSCRIKKNIIEIDEKETGLRRILNFGHTIGHAIEAESDYSISHGDGVSIGMIAAARISEKLKYLSSNDRERVENLTRVFGLSCRIPESIETEGILSRLKADKKKEGETIKFVLLKKLGMPFINGGVPEEIIEGTIKELKG